MPSPKATEAGRARDGGFVGALRAGALAAMGSTARRLARVARLRRALVASAERRMRSDGARDPASLRHPPAVEADKLSMKLAVLRTVERALAEDQLSDASLRGFLGLLIYDVLLKKGDRTAKSAFRAAHGCNPPDFLVISPGKACNLKCSGCYANAGPTREKLEWATLDRIVSEAHDLWGIRFFVLSGGEPLAYREDGKGVLDLAAEHQDCFFMMYTNGTLIDDGVARRMGELGNLSPGLSVEGLREPTDARRGAGVFDKVLAAIERLRRERVVFGISLTATRENADEILSDEVTDLFFGQLGAFYAWVFQYMPIGRSFSLDLMLTPEQRLRLWQRVWDLVRRRRLFIADFWNSGTATNGCVAGGRAGGYLYIDWNGAVSPCVFIPYAPTRIQDVYARGGSLNDVWAEPFFAGIRAWQRGYGYRENGEACPRCGNWINPCLIRDHHGEFQRLLGAFRPEPIDEDARAVLSDASYHQGLEEYDRALAALADPIWEEKYLGKRP